ncbi:MAG: hypothetical protein JWL63_898 [Rhodocyclales bacterium]|nr:hypothetical protein [Rhodocyclales bacterium]
MNNIEHMVEWHDKTLLASPVKALLAIPVWFFSAWIVFAVIAHFTSPHVALPEEALEGAGQKLDLKAIAAQPVAAN